ncbi:hypothetical protein GOODEAATRI_013777, partial [Goodea atripinnis]
QVSHENNIQPTRQLNQGAYQQSTAGQPHPGVFQQPAAQLHQAPCQCQTVFTGHITSCFGLTYYTITRQRVKQGHLTFISFHTLINHLGGTSTSQHHTSSLHSTHPLTFSQVQPTPFPAPHPEQELADQPVQVSAPHGTLGDVQHLETVPPVLPIGQTPLWGSRIDTESTAAAASPVPAPASISVSAKVQCTANLHPRGGHRPSSCHFVSTGSGCSSCYNFSSAARWHPHNSPSV